VALSIVGADGLPEGGYMRAKVAQEHLRLHQRVPHDAGQARVHYGTVAASIEFPAEQGVLPAFWMLGSDTDTVGWPAGGEIDVM
jgi:beta-glucanase (GH16 family)